jgi:hypothetical protein
LIKPWLLVDDESIQFFGRKQQVVKKQISDTISTREGGTAFNPFQCGMPVKRSWIFRVYKIYSPGKGHYAGF